MRKIVKIYVPVGRITHPNPAIGGGDTTGYPTQAAAQAALSRERHLDYWYPNGASIQERDFALPDDAFWTNDLVAVELYRSGSQSDDGIHSGGAWTSPVYGLVQVHTISLETGQINGRIIEPGTDRHIQSLPLHAGRAGFPYRNAVLVRANDVEDWQ